MRVCVITGGAGGMGISCARIKGKTHKLLLVDVSQEKLDSAVKLLADEGIADVVTDVCDVSNRDDVKRLAQKALQLGEIDTVLQLAGVSPAQLDSAETILRVNAIGLYNMIEEFYAVMGEGSNMVTVNSLATHMSARGATEEIYSVLDNPADPEFLSKLLEIATSAAEKVGTAPAGLAYSYSKLFSWRYSRRNVMRFYSKGIRINTVTPGIISTPMGLAEGGGSERMKAGMAIKRYGTPDEMAAAICFLTGETAGDITGVDLPVDGGYTCIMNFPQIEA